MYHQLFDRQVGGTSKCGKKGHNYQWRTPAPASELFLERLETASYDRINLGAYSFGLPLSCQFGKESSTSSLCAVTDEDGWVQIFDTQVSLMARQEARVHNWRAHMNAVFDFSWINGDTQCLTSSGDQTVALWDMEKTTAPITTMKGHHCSVRSVAPHPTCPAQLASGARDGHIMLWDTRIRQKPGGGHWPYKSIKYAHSLASRVDARKHRRNNRHSGPKGVIDTQHSVTCVLYQTDNLLISSGAMDGCVKFWDTRKWYSNSLSGLPTPVQTFEYPGKTRRLKASLSPTKGIVTMCMDPCKSQLFVSYTDNRVYRFDIAGTQTKPEEFVYAGHRNDIFYVRCAVSPDGRYLLSGSGRNTGVIWQIDEPRKQPVFLIGHTEDVSSVDWCRHDMSKLVTLSDDQTMRIWRPDPRERSTEDPDIVGFAYSAKKGKVCTRQARVEILQDEFPFQVREESDDDSARQPTPSPSQQSSPSRQAPAVAHPPTSQTTLVDVVKTLSWRHRARCLTPTRLTVKPLGHGPPSAAASPSSCSALQSLRPQRQQQFTPPPPHRPAGARDNSDSENGPTSTTPRRLLWQKDTPLTTAAITPDSRAAPFSARSPRTPHNCSSSALPFWSYRVASARKSSVSSESELEADSGSHSACVESRCLQTIDVNSPTKKSCTKRAGASPVKSPLRSPTKSGVGRSPVKKSFRPHSLVFNFSSPTANLPNSVVDPPPRRSPAPPGDGERKVDWLTSYRLARADSATSPRTGSCARQKLFLGDKASVSPSRDGDRSGTPNAKSHSPKPSAKNSTPKSTSKIGTPNAKNHSPTPSAKNSTPKSTTKIGTPDSKSGTPKAKRGTPNSKNSPPNSSSKSVTGKRKSVGVGEGGGEGGGGKRAKVDTPVKPGVTSAPSRSLTPNRRSVATSSPKTPSSMSIRHYFQ